MNRGFPTRQTKLKPDWLVIVISLAIGRRQIGQPVHIPFASFSLPLDHDLNHGTGTFENVLFSNDLQYITHDHSQNQHKILFLSFSLLLRILTLRVHQQTQILAPAQL